MKKQIKILTLISTLSIMISSCSSQSDCNNLQFKNINSLSENINYLNSTPEKIEVNSRTIESTYNIISVSDIRAIPEIFKDNCPTKFTIRLFDSKTKEGLFKDYTLEYYWFFSEEVKKSSEGYRYENSGNDNSTIRILNTPYLDTFNNTLIIKIKDKNGKSYLIKSINPYNRN